MDDILLLQMIKSFYYLSDHILDFALVKNVLSVIGKLSESLRIKILLLQSCRAQEPDNSCFNHL